MALNKKLINFVKKEFFTRRYANNEILNTSIIFIDDTKEIVTHDTTFGGNINGDIITLGGNSYTIPTRTNETISTGLISSDSEIILNLSWKEIPKSIYDDKLNKNGTYLIQIEWDKVIYVGVFPYKELTENTQYASEEDIPTINTDDEIVLTSCGYNSEDKGRLYLKLASGSRTTEETIISGSTTTTVNKPTKPSLFIACSKSNSDLGNLEFKFRQLL